MFSRILIFLCINLPFIGTCLSAEDSWYPKASDSCAKFSGDVNVHAANIYPKLVQHRGLVKYLWRDHTVLNLKKALDALLNENVYKTGKSGVDEAMDSAMTLTNLALYCNNHETTLLGDISALDVINDMREGGKAAKSASPAMPKLVTLNCSLNTMKIEGFPDLPPREETVAIDYTNNTVNGINAEFDENEIRWSYPLQNGSNYHVTLNRLSGSYNQTDDQSASIWNGHCVPATRQF